MFTNYVDKQGPVVSAAWLNGVDQLVNASQTFNAGGPQQAGGVVYTGVVGDSQNIGAVRNASYTGGTVGAVNGLLRLASNVGASVASNEWTIIGICNNNSTVATAQCVGGYFQGNMLGTAPTWGATCEATDMTFTGSAGKQGLTGLEVDAYINGADTNGNRIILHLVVGDANFNRGHGAGTFGRVANGILMESQIGGTVQSVSTGFQMHAQCDGTAFAANPVGALMQLGFTVQNQSAVGFDTSTAIIGTAAYRMAAGQSVAFDAASTNQLLFDGSRLRYDTVTGGVHTQQFAVQPNGYVAIGPVINNGTAALLTTTTNLVGASEQSALFNDTFNGTATNAGIVINSNIATGVASTTYDGIIVNNPTLIGGASISGVCVGVQVNALSSGTGGNRGISLNNAAGANNYNVYAVGTAKNLMGGPLGVNGNAPPAQVTGWGAPTGTGVIANFPGATATLAQCSQAIAQLITDIKAIGFYAT